MSETKLDSTFLNSQFNRNGFSTSVRVDGYHNGRVINIFVNNSTIVELLSKIYQVKKLMAKDNFSNDIEEFFMELNVRNSKWLPFGTNHSSAQNFRTYFHI